MSQDLPKTAGVDYEAFAFAHWTPGRVMFCLQHWADLEEAAKWGIESGQWPPLFGNEASVCCYPGNMSIMTTAADLHIAVRSLPPKQGAALVAYYRRGHGQRVIAEGLRCSERQVRRYMRAGEIGLTRKLVD